MLLPIIRSDRKQFTLARQKNWSVNLEHKEPSFILPLATDTEVNIKISAVRSLADICFLHVLNLVFSLCFSLKCPNPYPATLTRDQAAANPRS